VDLNGDGSDDILSGSYSRHDTDMAGTFQVLWGQGDGTFTTAVDLMGTDEQPLIIPTQSREQMTQKICTRPTAVDWDADGDLDLVVGNFAGSLYLFRGEAQGGFNPVPEPIMAGDSPLTVRGAHSDPVVVDWDGDGDLDILSGSSSGGVQWASNTAGQGEPPAFESFQTLIATGNRGPSGGILRASDLTGPGNSTRIWVDDVNLDGKLDLLVGDSTTLTTPAEGLSDEQFEQRYAQWNQDLQAAMAAMRALGPDAEQDAIYAARDHYDEVRQAQSEIMTQERTGFVWLYLQQ